jgi:hypothetical protein
MVKLAAVFSNVQLSRELSPKWKLNLEKANLESRNFAQTPGLVATVRV